VKDTRVYFGSFNPVHNGHTAIARHMADGGYGEVWLVVSPHNPLKEQSDLAPDADRLAMARIAAAATGDERIRVCDVEFSLPQPSYTIDTLRALGQQYPDRKFALLVGSDVFAQFDRWKEYRTLLEDYIIWVYPRDGATVGEYAPYVKMVTRAPLLPFSATDVRERLLRGEDCSTMLDPGVYEYIKEHGLWAPENGLTAAGQGSGDSSGPADGRAYLERGKSLYAQGLMGEALNDFMRAHELLPNDREAAEYIEMIREILEFRHTGIYNP
jgi:nicotinate-nucleotide adenylyltransferase